MMMAMLMNNRWGASKFYEENFCTRGGWQLDQDKPEGRAQSTFLPFGLKNNKDITCRNFQIKPIVNIIQFERCSRE